MVFTITNEARPTYSRLSLDGIIQKLRTIPKDVYEQYGVRFAYLGGSWAKGTPGWWSDIDIFLSVPSIQNKNPREILRLWLKLEGSVSEHIRPMRVELRFLESLPLHIQLDVVQSGIVVFDADTGDREAYLERLFNTAFDHNIWYRRLIEESI